MLDQTFANTFVHEWISAWNAHDLERVLSHYADDFEMTSPFIQAIAGNPTGRLKGKENVREYWQRSLEKFPNLHFELLDVLFSVNSLVIYYKSVLEKRAVEWFWFNEDGKVLTAIAHYSAE
ncbi:nuclear transport factor 2 family protein [Pantanalinema rosaneae CENA516]|uniref:nuclear transport factor 2 family protein n=1 Tax=Pantanalinema rosaneae TaxID=1620701 RepID=UPI003D6E4245